MVLPDDIARGWPKVGTLRRCRRGAEVCFQGFWEGFWGERGKTHTQFSSDGHTFTQENLRNTSKFCKRNSFFFLIDECLRCFFWHSFPCGFRKCFMTFRSAGVAVIQSCVVSSLQEGCCCRHSSEPRTLGQMIQLDYQVPNRLVKPPTGRR